MQRENPELIDRLSAPHPEVLRRGSSAARGSRTVADSAERDDLETGDMTALMSLVVPSSRREGLVRRAVSAVCPANAVKGKIPRALTLTTSSNTRASGRSRW